MQLQRLPGSYPYPDTIPDIRIFRISRGESQGSNLQPSSPNLESSRVSAVDIVVLVFSSSGDRADGTVRTARVSSVRLCTMGDLAPAGLGIASASGGPDAHRGAVGRHGDERLAQRRVVGAEGRQHELA